MPSTWQAPDFGDFLHEELEGEHFVFNPHTGHTHVVNAAALLLLKSLADQPLTGEELAQRLVLDYSEIELNELRELLRQQLEQLRLLGLVEPRP